jgi:hypothetical protein
MDRIAINELREHLSRMMSAAEECRNAAEKTERSREFFRALAVTYDRAAREMRIMLDAVARANAVSAKCVQSNGAALRHDDAGHLPREEISEMAQSATSL